MKLYIKSNDSLETSTAVETFLREVPTVNELSGSDGLKLLLDAYKEMISDYKQVPDEWNSYDLDETYEAQRTFYRNYIEFARRCKEFLADYTPGSGYSADSFVRYKIYDTLKRVDYNFPYGWKRR